MIVVAAPRDLPGPSARDDGTGHPVPRNREVGVVVLVISAERHVRGAPGAERFDQRLVTQVDPDSVHRSDRHVVFPEVPGDAVPAVAHVTAVVSHLRVRRVDLDEINELPSIGDDHVDVEVRAADLPAHVAGQLGAESDYDLGAVVRGRIEVPDLVVHRLVGVAAPALPGPEDTGLQPEALEVLGSVHESRRGHSHPSVSCESQAFCFAAWAVLTEFRISRAKWSLCPSTMALGAFRGQKKVDLIRNPFSRGRNW